MYVAYGGGHINMILEVYNQLRSNPNYEHIVFGLTAAQIKLKSLNIPFVSYLNYASFFDQALDYGKNLSQKQTNHLDIAPDETYAYLGVNFSEMVETHGREAAEKMYEEKGRRIFYPIKSMTKILKEIQPDLVVATNSPRSERAVLQAAKNLGIPSVCLVDIFDVNDLRPIAELNLGTKVCILNEYTRNLFQELGRTEGIVITGNPAFDHIYDQKYVIAAQKYRKEKNADGKTMILWARSSVAEDVPLSNSIEEKLIDFARQSPDFVIVLRPHPNEVFEKPQNLPPNVFYSLKNEDLYTVLHATDVLYTLYSTVGLEAHFIGKHVLQQTNTNSFKRFNLLEVCGAQGISDVSTLPEILKRYAGKPLSTAFLNRKSESAAAKIGQQVNELLDDQTAT